MASDRMHGAWHLGSCGSGVDVFAPWVYHGGKQFERDVLGFLLADERQRAMRCSAAEQKAVLIPRRRA